jgi:hypothetical protein
MTLFESFLTELAHVLQFATLTPDAKGGCLIVMKEDNIPLLFEFDEQLVPNTVLLSCLVCPIPLEKRAEVYEACLIGNQSIDACLSVKPDEDLLYLHRRFHPTIQATNLEKHLLQFLDTAQLWKKKVETITKTPLPPNKLPLHPSSLHIFPYKV